MDPVGLCTWICILQIYMTRKLLKKKKKKFIRVELG